MQLPSDPPPPGKRWATFEDAVTALHTTPTTLRRWIEEGKAEASRYPRNPDNPRDARSVWRVLIDDPPDDPPPPAASEESYPPAPAIDLPAVLEAATAPLSAALAAERAEKAKLAAENGMLRERAASAEASAAMLQTEVDRYRRVWWRKLKDALIGE